MVVENRQCKKKSLKGDHPQQNPSPFLILHMKKKVLLLFFLSDICTKKPVEMKEDKGTLQLRKIQRTWSSPGYI